MRKIILGAGIIGLLVLGGTLPATAGLFDQVQKTIKETTDSMTGGSSGSTGSAGSSLSVDQITAGLKEALRVGTDTVVSQIGAVNGYNGDPAIHIPLPEKMQQAQALLKKFGLSSMADEIEERLNRGAEAAAPKAREIVQKAITNMTLDDARAIYNGPSDAATQYFKKVSTTDLEAAVRPVMEQSLQEVGAIQLYDSLVEKYANYPLVPDIKTNLTSYATDEALDGLFHYLAIEEAAIRKDPVKQTTKILSTVFGN
ncbi:MAG: DUF4197 domain-containing protein [Alphaproteobacteria bacterium]|nr:MAG: DUF4197 domain-containing protein [Alphaproteobacteria bacterium]